MTAKNTDVRFHVRFDGRSYDLEPSQLGVAVDAADVDIHEALARHFDVARQTFRAYVVERHRNGSVTVRPEAVFG
ncbi:MAG: hypothetical protein AAB074_20425 [Planctomycetota bacterium]